MKIRRLCVLPVAPFPIIPQGNDVDGDYQNDTRRYFVELPSVNGNRGGPAGTKKPGSQGQQAVGSLKLNMSIQDIMRKVTNRIGTFQ